ncbi:hypothetical protein AB0I53_11075 [Saccharopolyspora sp. NPDC050389]|uniref:hypothetical protein n=1 Tax=Saccharopolyspora sp. NPDC050389 TaxID=3155516 RepID=UPI0033C187E2
MGDQEPEPLPGSTRNTFTGRATGPVVQAGSVGGVHFHDRPKKPWRKRPIPILLLLVFLGVPLLLFGAAAVFVFVAPVEAAAVVDDVLGFFRDVTEQIVTWFS